ncbi:MAG TPA: hypothetical protein VLH85_01590, partial [Levilinea sp.]|nr:hypothetical protein [Levilinea sp.]
MTTSFGSLVSSLLIIHYPGTIRPEFSIDAQEFLKSETPGKAQNPTPKIPRPGGGLEDDIGEQASG